MFVCWCGVHCMCLQYTMCSGAKYLYLWANEMCAARRSNGIPKCNSSMRFGFGFIRVCCLITRIMYMLRIGALRMVCMCSRREWMDGWSIYIHSRPPFLALVNTEKPSIDKRILSRKYSPADISEHGATFRNILCEGADTTYILYTVCSQQPSAGYI